MEICECGHSQSEHILANDGACGDSECCGSVYEFCYECVEACSFYPKGDK